MAQVLISTKPKVRILELGDRWYWQCRCGAHSALMGYSAAHRYGAVHEGDPHQRMILSIGNKHYRNFLV